MSYFLGVVVQGQTRVLLTLLIMLAAAKILALVSSLAIGAVNYLSIIATAFLAVGFTTFLVLVGAPLVKRVAHRIENLRVSQALFVSALLLCLGHH